MAHTYHRKADIHRGLHALFLCPYYNIVRTRTEATQTPLNAVIQRIWQKYMQPQREPLQAYKQSQAEPSAEVLRRLQHIGIDVSCEQVKP